MASKDLLDIDVKLEVDSGWSGDEGNDCLYVSVGVAIVLTKRAVFIQDFTDDRWQATYNAEGAWWLRGTRH